MHYSWEPPLLEQSLFSVSSKEYHVCSEFTGNNLIFPECHILKVQNRLPNCFQCLEHGYTFSPGLHTAVLITACGIREQPSLKDGFIRISSHLLHWHSSTCCRHHVSLAGSVEQPECTCWRHFCLWAVKSRSSAEWKPLTLLQFCISLGIAGPESSQFPWYIRQDVLQPLHWASLLTIRCLILCIWACIWGYVLL